MSYDFGHWHALGSSAVLILFLGTLIFDTIGAFMKDQRYTKLGNISLGLATFVLFLSFSLGYLVKIIAAKSMVSQEELAFQQSLETLCVWFLAILFVLRVSRWQDGPPLASKIYWGAVLGFTALLSKSSFQSLTHGGYTRFPRKENRLITARELANLSLDSSLEKLEYNDTLHQILAGTLLLLILWYVSQKLGRRSRKCSRFLGPILLMASGIFYFLFADLEAWPLSGEKSLTDPAVLSHKTAALLFILAGVASRLLEESQSTEAQEQQSYLFTTLSLVLGAILLTDVETSAPYSEFSSKRHIQQSLSGLIAFSSSAFKMYSLQQKKHELLSECVWLIGLLFSVVAMAQGFRS